MPEAFHIEVKGLDKLIDKLTALKGIVENKELVHEIFAAELFHATERAFENKRDPVTGKAWKEWTPKYAKRLAKLGKNDRRNMLYQKGANGGLFNAVHHWADAEGGHIGANIIYARIHQLGGRAGRGHRATIPARPYLGLDAQAREDIQQTIRDLLEDALDG